METPRSFVNSLGRYRRSVVFYNKIISEVKGLRERRRDLHKLTDEANIMAQRVSISAKLSGYECLKNIDRLFGRVLVEDMKL
jgi:hypothetical protein